MTQIHTLMSQVIQVSSEQFDSTQQSDCTGTPWQPYGRERGRRDHWQPSQLWVGWEKWGILTFWCLEVLGCFHKLLQCTSYWWHDDCRGNLITEEAITVIYCSLIYIIMNKSNIHLPNWSALIPMLNDKDKLLEIWKICPLRYCSARDVTIIEVLHTCTRCRQPRFLKVRKNGDCKYLTFRWGSSQQRTGPLIHCYPSVSG